MKAEGLDFNDIVETIYNLPLEYKEELRNLLDHNISDARRSQIAEHYKAAQNEERNGKLKFSSSVEQLKKRA
ncbi:MAG: hypothetical protein V4649_13875 [Bacteroidota bacterium]